MSNDGQDSRRNLENLNLLHTQLQPDFRDVYVEGRTDVTVVSWYLRQRGLKASGIYAIDDRAYVPASLVLDSGAEVGPRGRLLALAKYMDEWSMEHPGITCIVDRDWDLVTGSMQADHILYTDFPAVENYLFTAAPFSKLLQLVLGNDRPEQQVKAALTPLLNQLYAARLALHLEGGGVPGIDGFQGCCYRDGDRWLLNESLWIERSLAARRATDRKSAVLSKLEEIRVALTASFSAIRGHDIAPALILELGLKNEMAKPTVLEQAWRGCLSAEDLDHFPLFTSLRERLSQ